MVENTKQKKNDQDQQKIDQALDIFREEKKIFRDVDLSKDRGIIDQRSHTLPRRFTEIIENDYTTEEVSRVMRGIPSKEDREDHAHDQQLEQRVQDAPCHPDSSPGVAFLEIPLDQFLEQKLILSNL